MLVHGHSVSVFDHGYVKLLDWMGGDEDVIVAARQSTGRSFEGWEPGQVCKFCRCRPESLAGKSSCLEAGGVSEHVWESTRGDLPLLKRLWSEGHSTPFEMVQLKIQVQAPLMVFREWHRHRTQSFSEMSARYIQMPNLHYVPDLSRVRGQSKVNKQGSGDELSPSVVDDFRKSIEEEQQEIYGEYEGHLKHGVARELARLNTPVSRYSRMVASANLLNWFRFLGLRMPENAQFEIRQYANVVGYFIKQLWPRSWDLFEEYTLFSKRLSRSEISEARGILEELLAGSGNSDLVNSGLDSIRHQLLRLQTLLSA